MGKAETNWLLETELAETSHRRTMARPPAYTTNFTSLSQLERAAKGGVSMDQVDWTWTEAEIDKCLLADWGTLLEVSERQPDGKIIAKGRALIPADDQERVLSSFEEATGAPIRTGIKVPMLVCRGRFDAAGVSLRIGSLGSSYSWGAGETAKNEVRRRLKAEGLYSKNRELSRPQLTSILVIAPPSSDALADFEVEAQRLEKIGVCTFQYVGCRFQGARAVKDLERAVRQYSETFCAPDTLVLIRGGGSAADFSTLNDYGLTRAICESRIPVMVGLGHQNDNTLLDEVAYKSWGTPSKAIQGITEEIFRRGLEAKNVFSKTMVEALDQLSRYLNELSEIQNDWKRTILPIGPGVPKDRAVVEDPAKYLVDLNESMACLTDNLHAIQDGDLEINRLRQTVRQSRIHQNRIDRVLNYLQPKRLRPGI